MEEKASRCTCEPLVDMLQGRNRVVRGVDLNHREMTAVMMKTLLSGLHGFGIESSTLQQLQSERESESERKSKAKAMERNRG